MKEQPTLTTRCLLLRLFKLSDAPDVQILAGPRAISYTTLEIPYPYEEAMAERSQASDSPNEHKKLRKRRSIHAVHHPDGCAAAGDSGTAF
jgi:hypothetical protein